MLRYWPVGCSDGSGGGTLAGSTLASGEMLSSMAWMVAAGLQFIARLGRIKTTRSKRFHGIVHKGLIHNLSGSGVDPYIENRSGLEDGMVASSGLSESG